MGWRELPFCKKTEDFEKRKERMSVLEISEGKGRIPRKFSHFSSEK